ncbi:LysR family transcriptional regulator [Vibrio sinensis]|uniref:LysR family transcriptional regulator n=1 Tax=Vibrio sinensis TaxID=2302434 RepID=A0A3A6QSK8_9VIBR|nr:LysR family transcriptional regulator [Vibrio sinensis]RJX73636.1 LysR family transcriptional regulator [Vibrio sinensis]
MDKIRALRYFARTVELNSFSQVAAELNLPLSSISRRVKDLESELGIELIQRTTRRVKATELGLLYYQQIYPLLQKLDEADELVSQRKAAMAGRLSISCSVSFGERVLLPILYKFRQQYPNITLDVDFSDRVVNFNQDSVDIAIRAGQLHEERIVAKSLSSAAFKLVATPELLLNLQSKFQTTVLSLENIQQSPTLQYLHGRVPLTWWIECDGVWQQVQHMPIFSCNSGEALIHAALAGEGIALFPQWWVETYLRDGRLVDVPTQKIISNGKGANLDIYVVYQQAKYQIPKIKTCIDFILQHV